MHTALVVLGGMLLLWIFLLFGFPWGTSPTTLGFAALLFLSAWLILSAVNSWLRTVFLVPAFLAVLTHQHFSR